MAAYYLVSQLPSLDGIGENIPIPITEERFWELCDRFLGKKVRDEMRKLTLIPPLAFEKSNFALVEAWLEGECALRLALAKARADKLNKPFDLQNKTLSVELVKVAKAAVEIENPMEAENFLLHYRLRFLETLRPMDAFSEEYLFYYGLKLKLLLRTRMFDAQLGGVTYKNIYNSVLNGERLEAE